jgi:hypothetical protein
MEMRCHVLSEAPHNALNADLNIMWLIVPVRDCQLYASFSKTFFLRQNLPLP